jgi:hypothetical protein
MSGAAVGINITASIIRAMERFELLNAEGEFLTAEEGTRCWTSLKKKTSTMQM